MHLTQNESLSPLCLIWADTTFLSYSCPLASPHSAPTLLILLIFLHTRHPRIESPAQVVLCLEGSFPRGTWPPFPSSSVLCWNATLPLMPPWYCLYCPFVSTTYCSLFITFLTIGHAIYFNCLCVNYLFPHWSISTMRACIFILFCFVSDYIFNIEDCIWLNEQMAIFYKHSFA